MDNSNLKHNSWIKKQSNSIAYEGTNEFNTIMVRFHQATQFNSIIILLHSWILNVDRPKQNNQRTSNSWGNQYETGCNRNSSYKFSQTFKVYINYR